MLALLPATALVVFADVFAASAQSFYDQVFGSGTPGYSTYNPRTRSYRREQSAGQPKVVTAPKSQRDDFRKSAYGIGKIDNNLRNSRDERANRNAGSVRVHTPGGNGSWFDGAQFDSDGKGSYRTLCVRQCDGYFFPISFATSKRNFKSDAEACASQCGSPASLFYYPNPGAEVEDMISYETGKPYKELLNAFRYRKEFDASCRCLPEPWTEEAKAKHEQYALAKVDPLEEVKRQEAAARSVRRSKRYSSRGSRKGSRSRSASRVRVVTPGIAYTVKRAREVSVRRWSF